jgi:hypothetical protein
MPKQAKTKPTFEVGQTLHVSTSGGYWRMKKEEPKLEEYEVTRFNGSSVYLKSKEYPEQREKRFERKSLTHRDMFGEIYKAHIDPQVYWDGIARVEEKASLREYIEPKIQKLTLEQLRALKEYIDNL